MKNEVDLFEYIELSKRDRAQRGRGLYYFMGSEKEEVKGVDH